MYNLSKKSEENIFWHPAMLLSVENVRGNNSKKSKQNELPSSFRPPPKSVWGDKKWFTEGSYTFSISKKQIGFDLENESDT